MNCPFCPMFNKSADNEIIITPLNPVVPGHRLVIPREHVTDFADNPDVSARVMRRAAEEIHNLGGEWNLITSKGRSATQSVFHLHIHLVPRAVGDHLPLPWTPQQEEKK